MNEEDECNRRGNMREQLEAAGGIVDRLLFQLGQWQAVIKKALSITGEVPDDNLDTHEGEKK